MLVAVLKPAPSAISIHIAVSQPASSLVGRRDRSSLVAPVILADRGELETGELVIMSGRDDSAGGQRQALIDQWNGGGLTVECRPELPPECSTMPRPFAPYANGTPSRIAFDRPKVRNAFRPSTVDELCQALDHAQHEACALSSGQQVQHRLNRGGNRDLTTQRRTRGGARHDRSGPPSALAQRQGQARRSERAGSASRSARPRANVLLTCPARETNVHGVSHDRTVGIDYYSLCNPACPGRSSRPAKETQAEDAGGHA